MTKRSIMYIKIAFLGGFWYLNIHCIRKSIAAELLAAAHPDGSESPSLIKKYQSWAKSFDTFKRKCQATIIIKVGGWSKKQNRSKTKQHSQQQGSKVFADNSHHPISQQDFFAVLSKGFCSDWLVCIDYCIV